MANASLFTGVLHWAAQRSYFAGRGSSGTLRHLTGPLLYMCLGYLLFSLLLDRGPGVPWSRHHKGSADRHINTRPGVFTEQEWYSSGDSVEDFHVSEVMIPPGRDLLGARRRVGKVSMIIDDKSTDSVIYERAMRTHEAHDLIHGYPLHVLRHSLASDVWSKPAYILSLLLREMARPESQRLSWLFWVDADTVIMNPNIPIETFLPPSPEFDDIHLVLLTDSRGVNNGVFPIRVNQWAVDLFAAVVSFRHYRPDQELPIRDQSAMAILLDEPKFAKHTVYTNEQRWFNIYWCYHNETIRAQQVRPGDFLVHFAGTRRRSEYMAPYLERAEAHLPEWELPLQATSLPDEMAKFWTDQRRLRSARYLALNKARADAGVLLRATETALKTHRARLGESDTVAVMVRQKSLHEAMDQRDASPEEVVQAAEQLRQVSVGLLAGQGEQMEALGGLTGARSEAAGEDSAVTVTW